MSLLKRHVAPLTDGAWDEIDEQAKDTLTTQLSARRFVDVEGPLGWKTAAVNLGTLELLKEQSGGVKAGLRQVQPLVEIRIPFKLNIWDLDNIERGSETPELDAVEEAASKGAAFEEAAIYQGHKKAGITGIIPASPHAKQVLGESAESMLQGIQDAVSTLESAGIEGPYELVLGDTPYRRLLGHAPGGYPVRKRINSMTGGGIHWSPVLKSGLLMSVRGGHYQLTLGVDFSIGYEQHDADNVQLFLTEAFTFRVLEPKAAVPFS